MGNKNNFKLVLERIIEAQELLKIGVERGSLSPIERDILLEKLRASYEVILFDKAPLAATKPVEEQMVSAADNPQAPEEQKVRASELTSDKEPASSMVSAKEETTPNPSNCEKESVAQESQPQTNEDLKDDFALEEEPNLNIDIEPEEREVVFDKEDTVLTSSVEEPEQEGNFEGHGNGNGRSDTISTILGEKFQGKKKFRNEILGSGKKDMASHLKNKPISDLTKAIGINDKFLFTKELFNGNAELYANSIKQLNSYTNINDALIYIQENFSWDESNEAANQLIDLVRRKLLHD
ncbi:MAG: hypothetical protein RBR30_12860 [Tenuifilaceae bacterium]|nr:hypothetical protein [Tenuifilaceae bacterium]